MTRKRKRKAEREEGGPEFPGVDISLEPEITPYLVPTGIPGIYQSPVEPVDPHNCEQWPESPYCGGNPVSGNPLSRNGWMDLGVDVSINPCETCVTISPTLAHINLPPYVVCRRSNSPECVPVAPEPPVEPGEDEFPPRQPYRRRCPDGSEVFIGLKEDSDPEFTGGILLPRATEIYAVWEVLEAVGRTQSVDSISANQYAESISIGVEPLGAENFLNSVSSQWAVFKTINGELQQLEVPASTTVRFPYYYFVYWFDSYYQSDNRAPIGPRQEISFFPWDEACGVVGPPPSLVNPPPYPLERDPCCMACSGESEELLRLIAKRLGTSAYPFTVPQGLTADKSRSNKNLESLSEVIEWFILQFDALAGQFPVEIEIEDTDPTKEGNQTQKIKIDNIAEGIAELLGVSLNSSINTETLVNIGIRTLTEAGSAKNAAIVAQDVALANAEYLDYDLKQITREVPATFTPGKVELDDILQESTTKIRSYENVDDHQLKDYLTELLQGVAIVRAAFFRKLDPNNPYRTQVKDILKNLISLADKNLTKDEDGKPKQTSPTEDFDSFLERVERGFTGEAGIQDPENPYGRDLSERPRIRELGKQED